MEATHARASRASGEVEQMSPRAECVDVDQAVFFPSDGSYTEARRICVACPIKDECLADALERERGAGRNYRHGMFGGLTPAQRHGLAAGRTLTCVICEREFQGTRGKRACSPRCERIRKSRYMREYQRERRNNGLPNPIHAHGTVNSAHSDCTCPACRGRRRTLKRDSRLAQALREPAAA